MVRVCQNSSHMRVWFLAFTAATQVSFKNTDSFKSGILQEKTNKKSTLEILHLNSGELNNNNKKKCLLGQLKYQEEEISQNVQ